MRATLNEPVPIQVVASGGEEDMFARARVFKDGSLFATISLPHINGGMYGSTFTFVTAGYYSVLYELFSDAGFTTPAKYDVGGETIEVNSDKTNLTRLLGLSHDNAVLDQQTYTGGGDLLTARLRCYNSKANAEAAGSTGLLFTYLISATYTDGELTSYRVTRDA